jgi:hypothetical protein
LRPRFADRLHDYGIELPAELFDTGQPRIVAPRDGARS